MIYSVFAGMGKTTKAKENKNVIDLESSDFQWIYNDDAKHLTVEERKGNMSKIKNPNFVKEYVDKIEELDNERIKLLIACQPEILSEISKRKLKFITIYPDKKLKGEYVNRYISRGNNQGFVEFMENNFDSFCDNLEENENVIATIKVKKEGVYLADLI